jgi:hypothetical protein
MKKGEKWKIIFLDVDGVICTGRLRFNGLDPIPMGHLKRIIDETGAKVVISSSWRRRELEKTKSLFPEWLQEHIIDQTVFKHDYCKPTLQTYRGNEIQTWIHDHLDFPWYGYPELQENYTTRNEDGSFKIMNSNYANVDYTYVILDDDSDMLYWQKDNFVITNHKKGLNKRNANKAIRILNKI